MSWMDSWSRPGKSQATPAPYYLLPGGESTPYCRSCGRVVSSRKVNNSAEAATKNDKDKDNVVTATAKYCSARCRHSKPRKLDRDIEAAFVRLLCGEEVEVERAGAGEKGGGGDGDRDGGIGGELAKGNQPEEHTTRNAKTKPKTNPKVKVVNNKKKAVKGDPRILVSCDEVETAVFGPRNSDPEKTFGRKKNRASRVLPTSSENENENETSNGRRQEGEGGVGDEEDTVAIHSGDGSLGDFDVDEEEVAARPDIIDGDVLARLSIRSGTRVRPPQTVSEVNGSVGGEKGRAERIEETEEMARRRAEGQRWARQREMVRFLSNLCLVNKRFNEILSTHFYRELWFSGRNRDFLLDSEKFDLLLGNYRLKYVRNLVFCVHEDLPRGQRNGRERNTPDADPGTEDNANPGVEDNAEPGTEDDAEPGTEDDAELGTDNHGEPGTDNTGQNASNGDDDNNDDNNDDNKDDNNDGNNDDSDDEGEYPCTLASSNPRCLYNHKYEDAHFICLAPQLENFSWEGFSLFSDTVWALYRNCSELRAFELRSNQVDSRTGHHLNEERQPIRGPIWEQPVNVLFEVPTLPPFRNLRTLHIMQIWSYDFNFWREVIVEILVNSPNLTSLSLSIAHRARWWAMGPDHHQLSPEHHPAFFLRELCRLYSKEGGKPIRLRKLDLGHFMFILRSATRDHQLRPMIPDEYSNGGHLDLLVDSSQLQELKVDLVGATRFTEYPAEDLRTRWWPTAPGHLPALRKLTVQAPTFWFVQWATYCRHHGSPLDSMGMIEYDDYLDRYASVYADGSHDEAEWHELLCCEPRALLFHTDSENRGVCERLAACRSIKELAFHSVKARVNIRSLVAAMPQLESLWVMWPRAFRALTAQQQRIAHEQLVRDLASLGTALNSLASPISAAAAYGAPISTTVDLGYTIYDGTALAAGVNQYLGMRYAAAPLDDLRWRAPADPAVDRTPQDAAAFGPIFWLYIQGGGYAHNSNANYNGTEVVVASNHSVILVNFNYRVGAFGFLASEHIQRDGDLNVGLLDQRKAMQWVQQYIHLFGGNPDHVVIHGASAGAGSVSYHLTAYNGRDDHLFVGAVPESTFWPIHRTVPELEYQFDRFVANVSCSAASDVMQCLRSKNTTVLQSSDVASPYPGRVNNSLWYFTPCIDGNFSTDLLYNLFEAGKVVKVPTMVGDDTNEGSVFATDVATSEEFLEFMKDNYPRLTSSEIQRINATYPLMTPLPEHNAWFPSASAAYGESTFTCPGNQIAASMAKYLSPDQVWNYRYNVEDYSDAAAGVGTRHTAETPAIFGPPNGGCDDCSYDTYNAPIVPVVMDYWMSFVKTLSPNADRDPVAPYWQPWGAQGGNGTGTGRRLKFELNDTAMETVPLQQVHRCDLWRSLASTMEQ
ncbi:Uu.00g053430.m01.CDS01 [Anthostomella pinea]|uniref:Uu.00g053430.m01.CDS01 n=1 Tax=Anthostomella pinea TaxID=933095 RepID=A0AAI8VXM5_9PEZI|nr:Uu.00g053430.m01.CDS01 [Anthostomella pinea]